MPEILDRLRSCDQIQKGKAILEIFLRSLRRTSGHDNLPARPLGLPTPEPADFRECAVFGMLADRASIDQDYRCLVWILRLDQAARLQMP